MPRKARPDHRRPQRPERAWSPCWSNILSGGRSGTIRSGPSRLHRDYLRYFIDWCAVRGITQPAEVTKPIIERYQRYMFHFRKRERRPAELPQPARPAGADPWLVQVDGPQQPYSLQPGQRHRTAEAWSTGLPKFVLTASEAEQVINQANVNDPSGIRDRAILETFYSTGIRRMEMINLRPFDLDAERGVLMVRQGKGRKIA